MKNRINRMNHIEARISIKEFTQKYRWILVGLCMSLLCVLLFHFFYETIAARAAAENLNSIPNAVSEYTDELCNRYEIFAFALLFLAFLFPFTTKKDTWERFSIFRMPLEILLFLFVFLMNLQYKLCRLGSNAKFLLDSERFFLLFIAFFAFWTLGTDLRQIKTFGLWTYIQKKSLLYRLFPLFIHFIFHIDLSVDIRKKLVLFSLINGFAVFLLSLIFDSKLFFAVFYAFFLYFLLNKYISNIQKKYQILLEATKEMAKGNLNISLPDDLGIFEPFRPQIYSIQNGLKTAVEEEVKSQTLKTELITNVSHDLKTPLTAIITYINLLKEEDLTTQQQKYLATLEQKSLRLKVLIEDLFEISKATSRNIQLNIVPVDIVNLIKQTRLEMSDKLIQAGLEIRMMLPEQKILLLLDPQKTYRIYENLFGNIAKYALTGTRVYVTATTTQNEISIVLKNISAHELSVKPEELTDRFVRGDSSRNTEGSGLGLAIAKSFTELQGGKLLLETDGDLFKVTTLWPIPSTKTCPGLPSDKPMKE